jgi:uncharacterized protein YceH (UPF0502 family)
MRHSYDLVSTRPRGRQGTTLLPELTANEARVIGCLIEKSITTPDQYPLTLNALTNACNQKTGRNPVMNLSQGEVQHAVRELEGKHLVRSEENFKSRVEKYVQRFCNTRYSEYHFDAPELAIVCLLLLRGPQTPGELRSRSGRLHSFDDNADVAATLAKLTDREGGPLLVKLPRTQGRQDSEYMHLFGGHFDVEAYAEKQQAEKPAGSAGRASVDDLAKRVAQLEVDVAELKQLIAHQAQE